MDIRIGCSGFYNAHWKKIFYPEEMPRKDWLSFYCEKLNTLELNNTFYKFPTLKTMSSWYQRSPADFLFSVKAPKLITHLSRFNDCEQLMEDFYSVCTEGLNEKLGCLLFQLPPSIAYDEEKLQNIIRYIRPGFKNVIEFRHTSWWNEKVYNTLAGHDIIFCSVNHPKLPNTLVINSDKVYIRLHGNPEMFYSNYSTEFLNKLSQFILTKKNLKEIFIYFNNTASTSGVLNALELREIFNI
ncbi:MAG TPA: DUF72 domain-containing protein [Cytophagaceae bacterium]|nr:DUF72 domain-containing protein [Cytophagaceae bacterium]